jgi:hypothetical protein
LFIYNISRKKKFFFQDYIVKTMPAQITTKPKMRGFVGDFLGAVVSPLATLAGASIGGPLGATIGGGLGSAISSEIKKLPFKKGGQVQKPKRLKKGSKEAKAYMAKLRSMRR